MANPANNPMLDNHAPVRLQLSLTACNDAIPSTRSASTLAARKLSCTIRDTFNALADRF